MIKRGWAKKCDWNLERRPQRKDCWLFVHHQCNLAQMIWWDGVLVMKFTEDFRIHQKSLYLFAVADIQVVLTPWIGAIQGPEMTKLITVNTTRLWSSQCAKVKVVRYWTTGLWQEGNLTDSGSFKQKDDTWLHTMGILTVEYHMIGGPPVTLPDPLPHCRVLGR